MVKGWRSVKRGLSKRFKEVRFERKEGSDFVSVTLDGEVWNVWNGDTFDPGGVQLNKRPIKTKAKALTFARNWMKRHPKG